MKIPAVEEPNAGGVKPNGGGAAPYCAAPVHAGCWVPYPAWPVGYWPYIARKRVSGEKTVWLYGPEEWAEDKAMSFVFPVAHVVRREPVHAYTLTLNDRGPLRTYSQLELNE